jgi:3',5'-cyclic AMP phosphodiesterase CpdA
MSTLEREHKVVFQISDVHITPAEQFEEADKALTPGVTAHTDNFETLRWILGTLTEISPRPGIIVFSGDVADNGRPAAYRRVRELVEPAARAAGARVMWLPGNHDKLSAFRKSLLDWEPSEEPVDQVLWDATRG